MAVVKYSDFCSNPIEASLRAPSGILWIEIFHLHEVVGAVTDHADGVWSCPRRILW